MTMGPDVATVAEALAMALELQQAGRLDEAAVILERVRAAAPDLPDAHYMAGLLAAGRGDFAHALPALARAVALRPAVPALRLAWAQALRAAGERLAAATRFQEVAEERTASLPMRVEAASSLARFHRDAGDPVAALPWHTLWADLAPDDPAAQADLGHCLVLLGCGDDARAAYGRALALLPDAAAPARLGIADALDHLGATALESGRAEDARLACALALAARRGHVGAALTLARALSTLGDGEGAAGVLEDVLASDAVPADRLVAAEMLWRLRGGQGRRDLAAAALETALDLAPDRADLWALLGGHRRELGRTLPALAAFDRALALMTEGGRQGDHPPHPGEISRIQVNRATLLLALGRRDEAAATLPALRTITPAAGDTGVADGHCLARLFADLDAWEDLGRLVADLAAHWRERGYFWKTAYYVALETGNQLWRQGRAAALPALALAAGGARGVEPLLEGWWDFLDGCVALRLGDVGGARAGFARAGGHGLTFAAQIPLRGGDGTAGRDDWEAALAAAVPLRAAHEAGLTWLTPSPGRPGEPVVLVAADGGYVRRYLPLLAASIAARAPATRLHVHLVDPAPADGAAISAVASDHPGLRLGVSTETMEAALAADSRAAFLTAVRFLRLPQIQERYGAGMVVADIDAAFLTDPAAFVEALTPARPVAGTWGPDNLAAPYDAMGGGLVVVRADAVPARAFTRAVSDFLLHHRQRAVEGLAPMGYFIDQVALSAAAERLMGGQGPGGQGPGGQGEGGQGAGGQGGGGLAVISRDGDGRVQRLGAGAFVQLLGEKSRPDLEAALAGVVGELRAGGDPMAALERLFTPSGPVVATPG